MFLNVANGPGLGAIARRPVASAYRGPNGKLYVRLPIVMRRHGMGDASLFTRPAPDGLPGTEIVDASGSVVYSWQQVAADPSLIAHLGASSGCRNGTLPVWFPGSAATGGGPVCADPGAIVPGEGNSPFAQFEYPINGQCNPGVWCFTGSSLNDPNSYTWTGGGTPDVMNPAYVRNPGVPYPVPYGTDPILTQPRIIPLPMTPPVVVNRDPIPVYPPAPHPPAPVASSAAIANTSRPGQSFKVGDSWRLTVTGAPNSPVIGAASQNGSSLGATPYGNTDASGTMVLTGSMDSSTVGNWSETWTVGNTPAPALTFSVAGAPAPAPNTTPPAGGGAGSSSTGSSSTAGIQDFLTQSVSIAGISVPLWGAIAAGGVALMLFSGGSRK
jgi:hypothetical protein